MMIFTLVMPATIDRLKKHSPFMLLWIIFIYYLLLLLLFCNYPANSGEAPYLDKFKQIWGT